mmetsp:Transcript_18474/g.22625  ORF Transcript_18474/g.22625 Transcript_18474/m.22625 type:complete len:133 (-) Transcript_18474:563-961(-)
MPNNSIIDFIIYPEGNQVHKSDKIDYDKYLHEFAAQLDRLHEPIPTLQALLRKRHRDIKNRRLGVSDVQYQVGDYVLVSIIKTWRHTKASMRWEGLYQVSKVDNDNVYWVVEISLDEEVTNEPFACTTYAFL